MKAGFSEHMIQKVYNTVMDILLLLSQGRYGDVFTLTVTGSNYASTGFSMQNDKIVLTPVFSSADSISCRTIILNRCPMLRIIF
jgi:hypothetical protein